jgi:hypothetical protein
LRRIRSKLAELAFDEAHATTVLSDTLVAVWKGDPSAARLTSLGAELRTISQRNEGRVFVYNVITATTPVPTYESLAALQTQFNAMRGQLVALAVVLEKTGVEGTLSRAMLSTVITATRQPFPLRVFADRRDGAGWLGSQNCSIPSDRLVSLASGLEAHLNDPAAVRSIRPRERVPE